MDHKIKSLGLPDIKPQSPVTSMWRGAFEATSETFDISLVAPIVGFSPTFIKRALGSKNRLDGPDILALLDLDDFAETFVPKSKILEHLLAAKAKRFAPKELAADMSFRLVQENALSFLRSLPDESIQCVVTSTPYWAMRIYKDATYTQWADGDFSPFGHEQTPEGFLRHTTEILSEIYRVLKLDGSVWWNIMDSFNTRTQIRGSAVEALRAMQGNDKRRWSEHDCRRYSAGHAFLKDGEQCLIPGRIAERASRIGFYNKSVITWAKRSTLPEPQGSRVSRNLEYVLHLTKTRTPKFNKEAYRELPASLGGRNNGWETDKLSDVWTLPTSSGRDGHGAQFPPALPGRCIALSTDENDVVLDPFVGAGNAGVAAIALGRRFLGTDVSAVYLATAKRRISEANERRTNLNIDEVVRLDGD